MSTCPSPAQTSRER